MPFFLYIVLIIFLPGNTSDKSYSEDLTVSYSISLNSKKSNTGIGETYNGGVKTVYIKNRQSRIRLVSLMWIQDIFLFPDTSRQRAVIVKESGKDKYRVPLSAAEWKQYNEKYSGVTCQFLDDTATILDQVCRKAIINLKDHKSVTVYYCARFRKPELSEIEPLFACIPGLVLKYEYKYRKGTIVYTATAIDHDPIDPAVFVVPQKGYAEKKFIPSAPSQ